MKWRKILSFLPLFLLSLSSWGVEMKIKSFEEKLEPMTAVMQRKDDNDEICALVKVFLPTAGAVFEGNIVGSCEYKVAEYWCYLTPGSKFLRVKYPGYEPLMVDFSSRIGHGLEGKRIYELNLEAHAPVTISPPLTATHEPRVTASAPIVYHTGNTNPSYYHQTKISFSDISQIYADLFFQAGQYMGVGAALGGYFHAINAEIEFTKGISKSGRVFWYDKNEIIANDQYSSWSGNIKLGYGFQFKNRFQVTPQFGVGLLKCTSSKTNPANNANAVFGLIGARGSFTFSHHLQVTLAPYYSFAFKKSSSFEEISNLQPSINHWASGFSVKIGFTVFF